MNKKKKKRELPVTGILVGIIAVLLICVIILGWMVLKMDQRTRDRNGQNSENTAVQETTTGSITETLASSSSETKLQSEEQTGKELQSEDVLETETEESSEISSEVNMESESEVLIALETEQESEVQTEEAEKLVVAIDPGHQGNWVDMSEQEPNGPGSSEMKAKATTGTQGAYSGKAEYELNLEVSLLLRDELETRGYEVILTREDHDTAISNSERALKAYEEGGDIYVRIHANGADDSSVSGALAMVPSADNPYVGELAADSYLLADCILKGYCEAAEFESLGIQYYDNMSGINWSKLPVMILEMGFMTNESDDLRMADEAVQVKMAEGIADGIDEYFVQKGMKTAEVSSEATVQMSSLMEQLNESYILPAANAGETWSISMVDLATGAQGEIDGNIPMKSASVIKVFIMAAIYDRVCYPSSPERYIPIAESYEGELRQLITDMITVSDNTASNTLLEALGQGDAQAGMAVVNQFCEENGYAGTRVGRKFLESNPTGDNYTTANDCCRLLQSIYEGTCVNAEASAKMYTFLKNQTRTGKIPAGITGTGTLTANKTGELYGEYGDVVENDIAIVEDGTSAYVLCVLSRDLNDNAAAVTRINNISRFVYENK